MSEYRGARVRFPLAGPVLAAVGGLCCLALPLGCSKAQSQENQNTPPTVEVTHPLNEEVTDYEEYTGRTAAVDSVNVRARVSGYLNKVFFKEGQLVDQGEELFEIDPRPYQALVDFSKGQLASSEATVKRAKSDNARNKELEAKSPGAISLQDLDQSQAAEDAAAGALQQAQATLQTNKLNLSFTKVTAPIKGRTSNFNVTVGNLIVQDQTLLTTIVSIDPMYAYFDVDERTVLHVRRLIREGKAKSARDTTIPVYLALANDVGFPHQGKIDFVDNQNNLKTGTLRIRGVFENSKEILTPGLFVRVRIPIGQPHQALLITDRAIDTDLGEKIVYIVNEQDKIETRRVTLGKQHNGLRAIEEGLQSSDRVVINGLQQIRPGLKVMPKLVKQEEKEKSITPATDSGSHSKPEPSDKPDEKTNSSSQQTSPETATGAKPSSGEPAPSKPPENGAATPVEEPSKNTPSKNTPSQNTPEKKSADGAPQEASASVVAFRFLRQRASAARTIFTSDLRRSLRAAHQNEPSALAGGSPRGSTVLLP